MSLDRLSQRAFRHLVEEALGLSFRQDQVQDLERALDRARAKMGFSDFHALFDHLDHSNPASEAWRQLREDLTTGETYFFRDPGQLEAIKTHVFQEFLKGSPRTLRFWSAGCSSGEEAYTLAILAQEIFPASHGWQVEILGTDLNEAALEKARKGLYRSWSFRGMLPTLRDRWFLPEGEGWRVHPSLKSTVRFQQHNLVADSITLLLGPRAFDFILNRNVLIYFSTRSKALVLSLFREALHPDGFLVLGHGELGPDRPEHFQMEVLRDTTLLRPKERRSHPSVPFPAPSLPAPTQSAPILQEPIKPPVQSVRSFQPKPSSPLEQAKLALDRGDSLQALHQLETLLEANPLREDALVLLVHALSNLGRSSQAQERLREGLRRNPGSHRLHYLQFLLFSEQGKEGEALEALNRTLDLDPRHLAARLDRVRLRQAQKQWAEAILDLDAALRILEALDPHGLVEGLDGQQVGELEAQCKDLREFLASQRGGRP